MQKRFQYLIKEKDGKKIYYINWINYPIKENVYKCIKRVIMNSTDYSIFNKKNNSQIFHTLSQINNLYDTNITPDQYVSLRNILLKQKMIKKSC